MAVAPTIVMPEESRDQRKARARELLLDGRSVDDVVDATGLSRATVNGLKNGKQPGASAPKSTQRPTLSAHSAPPAGESFSPAGGHTSAAEAKRRIGSSWATFWNGMASIWDEPELAISDRERELFAAPWTDVCEQMGWLDHTKKLAIGEAIGVTAVQAMPRIKKLGSMNVNQLRGRRPNMAVSVEPEFRRPSPMSQPPSGDVPPIYEDLNGNQYGPAIDIGSPLNEPNSRF